MEKSTRLTVFKATDYTWLEDHQILCGCSARHSDWNTRLCSWFVPLWGLLYDLSVPRWRKTANLIRTLISCGNNLKSPPRREHVYTPKQNNQRHSCKTATAVVGDVFAGPCDSIIKFEDFREATTLADPLYLLAGFVS